MATRQERERRWRSRPFGAGVVRIAVFAVPVLASVAVAATLSRLVSPAPDVPGLLVRAAAILVPATVTLWLVDRLARRFLPLAMLLRLSLLFPDRAPSRYAIARLVNSTRELQRRVDSAREGRIGREPGEAAETILALVSAVSLHDRRTRGHSERVRIYTDLLAEEIGLPAGERDRLRWTALVHDTGKLTVPERILNKAGRPNEDEWEVLRRHPAEGARLCAPLLPWLGEVGRAIVEHHERFDGGGYPAGLAGKEISLAGRILAVADAFEVMTASRPYKRAISAAAAREELARCADGQFDPVIVRAFLSISLGRLRLAMGPLSWLAQWPFLSHLPQFGQNAGQAGAALGGAAALGAAGLLAGPTAVPLVDRPPATADADPIDAEAGDLADLTRADEPAAQRVQRVQPLATSDPGTAASEDGTEVDPVPAPSPEVEPAAPPPAETSARAPTTPQQPRPPVAAPTPRQEGETGGAAVAAGGEAARDTAAPDDGGTGTSTGGLTSGADDLLETVDGTVEDVVTGTVDGLVGTVDDVVGAVDDLAGGTVDDVVGTVEGIADDVLDPLPDELTDPVDDLLDGAGGLLDDPLGSLRRGLFR